MIIGNKELNASVEDILNRLKQDNVSDKLSVIGRSGDNYKITCPIHSEGHEKHPSCFINREGVWHCFTCGEKGYIDKLTSLVLDKDIDDARKWLLSTFGATLLEEQLNLPIIDLNATKTILRINERILDTFQSYHPYMTQRKLTKEVIERYKIKYDPLTQCIVFPVWNENNELVMLTRRSVKDKKFIIDKDNQKPVYLLNFALNDNVNHLFVCESQINALTLLSWGFNAIALIGTGTTHQYNILNKTSIRAYTLCFDGDEAGDKGIKRFKDNIRKDVLVDIVKIPRGKDVNDLTIEEFKNLPLIV